MKTTISVVLSLTNGKENIQLEVISSKSELNTSLHVGGGSANLLV